GTRQTGCFVPEANGLVALARPPAKWLKMTLLPMFVPPTTATTRKASSVNCGSSLRSSNSNQSRRDSGGSCSKSACDSSCRTAASKRRTSSAQAVYGEVMRNPKLEIRNSKPKGKLKQEIFRHD